MNGSVTVTAQYSNGVDVFDETIDMTGGTLDVLTQKVQNRLNTLNINEALFTELASSISTGLVIDPAQPASVLSS